MKFIEKALKIDYSLADWFSKRKETIIPATAFLFLNKVSFLFIGLYFFILPLLPFKLSKVVSLGMLVGSIALIMYGLQGNIEAITRNLNYTKEYSKLPNAKRIIQRAFGLILLISCFVLMFIIGVLCFEGYYGSVSK